MSHDIVIRNGTVIDGTGSPGRVADVAIEGDRVVEIGTDVGSGTREIDAEGRMVTPGFVDLHTHLDAQIGWDPLCSSSCWHGVTSVVMGNCGVTFAPVPESGPQYLAEMMESVEDIPADTILQGLPWDWTTYGEYLDTVERLPKGINVGGMVGHSAVRYAAMGERSLDPTVEPRADEYEKMRGYVDEAMAAGALGFSTSRTLRHKVPDGRQVPGTFASAEELRVLADVLRVRGRGIIETAPRFDGEGPTLPRVETELAWMSDVSRASGRPLTFNLTQTREQGDHWKEAIRLAEAANAAGGKIRPQTTSRSVGVLMSLYNMTPFGGGETWQSLGGQTMDEKLARLRDPSTRATLIAEADAGPPRDFLERLFVMTEERGARYDCQPDDALTAHAARRGVSPGEAFIDLCLETNGTLVINWPLLNQDLDEVSKMLTTKSVLMGLADAGAHVGQVLDASQPTFFLSYWVRERGLMAVEEAVRKLTSDTANFVGLEGRGTLAPGSFADVNIIDFDALALPVPGFAYDFPGGAGRYVQNASGYDMTIVNGEVFMEHGEHAGALAGSLLRSGPDLR